MRKKNPKKKPKVKTSDIEDALKEMYAPAGRRNQWAFFRELRMGTGHKKGADQGIDAYVLNLWPSKNFLSIAFEIKVTRSDFQRELANPIKRYPAMTVSNQFYFVTPEGLVEVDEIPELCGLMEVSAFGDITIVKKAVVRPKQGPTWDFVASICRRVARAEKP